MIDEPLLDGPRGDPKRIPPGRVVAQELAARGWSDADVARQAAEARLAMAANGHGELSAVLKWTDGREAYRPMPVERILPEPPPRILSIAAVD